MLEDFLRGIVAEPQANDRWLVLGDWLEEHDDPRRAELLRLHRKLLATCCDPDQHPERAVWQARIVALLGQGVQPCLPQRTVVLAKGVEMTFSFIPAGSYLAGTPFWEVGPGEEETRQRVTAMEGFYLGVFLVTQAQWRAVLGHNPSQFQGDDLPVEQVTWKDCMRFCKRLGRMVGQRFALTRRKVVSPSTTASTGTS